MNSEPAFPEIEAAAVFDPTRRYRYSLDRVIGPGSRLCAFVMLNPSTADATKDDPTVRRCVGFARGWGFGRLRVVNLFAIRATDPREMLAAEDPVGPENDAAIAAAALEADLVVASWGSHGDHRERAAAVLEILERAGPVHALSLTLWGQPRHPLYLRGDLRPRLIAELAGP